MHYINGMRQSPFPQSHWTDGLEQNEIVKTLIDNGSALRYLERLSREAIKTDHLTAIDRTVFLEKVESLDEYLKFDGGASLIIMILLEKDKKVIPYTNKEVGALIRFNHRWPNVEGIFHVDVLMEAVKKMTLNPAQLSELERLLNKIDRTLGFDLPEIPLPTEQEKYEAIQHLTYRDIEKKPRRFYEIFKADMLANGTPVTMKAKQFREYAEKVLKP